ncbi:C4-dicarboxylate transporter DcuC [Vibrio sp. SS-MA-C1-2]|uniref:C4-dicarboxylate transporter DcuC n=1 Tax=Vibrio sp. SS-MA-C1-2 TaxID=2908646 RepID=UPI001F1AAD64|nr:C4-dicarboxylate transporter DcuC [Vibrio sp. SS-MA-C1-2]UJF17884.1 C4-dicarboxylate transporter DcuC [Vibrio sp. SS-MA-C1-2]
MLSILLVILVIVFAARLILKGYKTEPVLLSAGLILMFSASIFGWGSVLPSKVAATNIAAFDPFKYIQYLMGYRAGALGLMIMALVGFSEYMSHIGADKVVVKQAIKPLSMIKNKNILLFFAYMVGALLQLAIPSATALAVLLSVTLFPIMTGLGISRGAAAAVIASTLATTFTPIGVDAIRASEALHMELMDYLVNYQAPTSFVATIAIGVAHVFWQSYIDNKGGASVDNSVLEDEENKDHVAAPNLYFILPFLPIIFAVIFSKLVIDTVKLDVTTIVLIAVFISMVCEGIRTRSLKSLFDGFGVFMKGMGNAFTTVVFLLVAAGVFAHGIQSTGAIEHMIIGAKSAGMPFMGLTLLFCLVVGASSVVMGSGNAAFLAFVEVIPTIAHSMGANPLSMMLPVQQVSAMGRAASPVAACVIVSAGRAKLSTFEVVKRTSVPVIIGFIVQFSAVLLFIG